MPYCTMKLTAGDGATRREKVGGDPVAETHNGSTSPTRRIASAKLDASASGAARAGSELMVSHARTGARTHWAPRAAACVVA